MAMDYGDGAAPDPEGQMGRYAIEAATSLFGQLRNAYPEMDQTPSDAELWQQIGVTPMIGQNDVPSQRFYLEDARQLLEFSQQREMGFISRWSANRDSACDALGQLALDCSAVPQQPGEFSRTLNTFTTAMEPALRVSDIAVLEGDPVTTSISSQQTSGNQFVDVSGQTVKIAGVKVGLVRRPIPSPHTACVPATGRTCWIKSSKQGSTQSACRLAISCLTQNAFLMQSTFLSIQTSQG